MAISIKDPETGRLARALAAATGVTITDAIRSALRDRLEREWRRGAPSVAVQIRHVQEHVAGLPVLDPRGANEIVGYGDDGDGLRRAPQKQHAIQHVPVRSGNSAPDSASPPDGA